MVKKAAESIPNQRLRMARKERGWTQKDVADHIGSPLALNVSRWESGTAFPSAHYVEKLCQLFGKGARELGLVQDEGEASVATPPLSSAQTPATPRVLQNIPYRRNPFFTGREALLTQLHAQLRLKAERTEPLVHALNGLGGIGKTQLAIEYAYRYGQEYRAVFWMRATTHDTLLADLVTLAELLDLPERDAREQHIVVSAVWRWLAQHHGWLLILDNADTPQLVTEFLPPQGNGVILVTTRSQTIGRIASATAIEKLDQREGTMLLLRRARKLGVDAALEEARADDGQQAQAIMAAMDGLPLALDQAGAYIEETGCGLNEYLELYHQQRTLLLNHQSDEASDYPYTVVSTWSLSFRQVEEGDPAAADVLRLCSFLDPEAIPEEIITEGTPALGPVLQPISGNPLHWHEIIKLLRRYSLVRRNPDTRVLSVHSLVQAVLKDGMEHWMQRQWGEYAVRAVNHVFPQSQISEWPRSLRLLPQAQYCAKLIEQYDLAFPEAAHLLHKAGYYLLDHAQYEQAESCFRRALAIREQALGSEHPDTLSTLYAQARLHWIRGHYGQAEALYQQVLTTYERMHGQEHADTASALHALARLYWSQGQRERSEQFYQQALAIRKRVLGTEHASTASTMHALAVLYRDRGELDRAEPLFLQALAIGERMLSPKNTGSANTRLQLGRLYQLRGNYERAEALSQRALSIFEELIGPQHPGTASALRQLAELHHLLGRDELAEQFYLRALNIYEQVLGFQHPDAANTFRQLITFYTERGQFERAEPLYQRALTIYEKALGPEHPGVHEIIVHYSELLRTMGRTQEATQLEARLQRGKRE